MKDSRRTLILPLLLAGIGLMVACGSRSALRVLDGPATGGSGGNGGDPAGGGGTGGIGGFGGFGGNGGEGGVVTCQPGETLVCGSDTGECETGLQHCIDGEFGPCEGAIDPVAELCNGLDEDCDGYNDNGFGLGQPCDGPDSDFCKDDVVICDGCSTGPSDLEVCNGIDDNCNDIIDSDCVIGNCQPELLVTGSTPSSPSCIDFPVEAGSTGVIEYPCSGGPVSATLGNITFSGQVTDGNVFLSGTAQQIGPDNCLWQMDHYIQGWIPSGQLQYSYAETLLDTDPWCWMPCTEVGDVQINWTD